MAAVHSFTVAPSNSNSLATSDCILFHPEDFREILGVAPFVFEITVQVIVSHHVPAFATYFIARSSLRVKKGEVQTNKMQRDAAHVELGQSLIVNQINPSDHLVLASHMTLCLDSTSNGLLSGTGREILASILGTQYAGHMLRVDQTIATTLFGSRVPFMATLLRATAAPGTDPSRISASTTYCITPETAFEFVKRA